jgi:NADPH-dependent 2,4-dienoyl-CoA reductase/sulfur reductase-like enzyme/nitrite reductase/ring-hydroxylating ferredoxin subunit
MSTADSSLPDLRHGIPMVSVTPGRLVRARVGDEEVIVARVGEEFLVAGAFCTHYHGTLADGLLVGDTVRCPLHHACFSLRTGEALAAPALDPIGCWPTERQGDLVRVAAKLPEPAPGTPVRPPASVVIIGGGAAGFAAAQTLRREGYAGSIAMISADADPPCDRPNLSKEFLSGEAQEDWIPLRGQDFYDEQTIELVLNARVTSIDAKARQLTLADGSRRSYDALLIATGATPVELQIPGAAPGRVRYLRSLADSKAIIAKANKGAHAVVIGASFIGLEVAASLRIRELTVHVVAPDKTPLVKVLGPELGARVRELHEAKGVTFHLGETVARADATSVTLSGGTTIGADLVVAGVGVRPATAVAETAGLAVDNGVLVNEYLESSVPGIFAAGDVARWLDRRSGQRMRVEHWVVAERQGQVAARNILGARVPFADVPFFWSQHYDTTIRYVGHADRWDDLAVDGDVTSSCAVSFKSGGRTLAVATIGRDLESLRAGENLARA